MEDAALGATPPAKPTASEVVSASHPVNRPLPLRTYGESESPGMVSQIPLNGQTQRNSTYAPPHLERAPSWRVTPEHAKQHEMKSTTTNGPRANHERSGQFAAPRHGERRDIKPIQALASNPSPPITPTMNKETVSSGEDQIEILQYDFSRIDYELDRTRSIDTGRWSTVHFAKPLAHSPKQEVPTASSPPDTPSLGSIDVPCGWFVVKIPNGASAKKIFMQEAKVLTKLQQAEDSHEYIVPFYGIDERISALVFEGVGSGPPENPSLEGYVQRFATMTEHERHAEFRDSFITAARDLVSGLKFIHGHGIVHADIKPANVLLDIQRAESTKVHVLRARYIDFSASFYSGSDTSNAGGTWSYMAPEQIYTYQEPPTFASDVWSLGITLLFILVGRSPYAETCGTDEFRIREAVKEGKPLDRARYDPVVSQRMKACQDLLDCSLVRDKVAEVRVAMIEVSKEFTDVS